MSNLNSFTVLVELLGYDVVVVEAEDVASATARVRDILRAEQKYQQATFRPVFAVLKSVRLNPDDVENLSRRGRDQLHHPVCVIEETTHDPQD